VIVPPISIFFAAADLRTMQMLLGHRDLEETTIYLHLSRRHLSPSPLVGFFPFTLDLQSEEKIDVPKSKPICGLGRFRSNLFAELSFAARLQRSYGDRPPTCWQQFGSTWYNAQSPASRIRRSLCMPDHCLLIQC
jgi:hypothetical protein